MPAPLADHFHLQLFRSFRCCLILAKHRRQSVQFFYATTVCSSLKRDMLKSWVALSSTLRSSSAMSLLIARTSTEKLHFQPFSASTRDRLFVSMTCDEFAAPRPVLAPSTSDVPGTAVPTGAQKFPILRVPSAHSHHTPPQDSQCQMSCLVFQLLHYLHPSSFCVYLNFCSVSHFLSFPFSSVQHAAVDHIAHAPLLHEETTIPVNHSACQELPVRGTCFVDSVCFVFVHPNYLDFQDVWFQHLFVASHFLHYKMFRSPCRSKLL